MKPNIFDYATNELSQDAFVAWLLNYADPSRRDGTYNFDDEGLYICGTKLIREMLFTHDITIDSKIRKVTAECQKEGVDIWTEIELLNKKQYLILIEHNTDTIRYSDELRNYRTAAAEYCSQNNIEGPVCIYLKTGDEAKASVENVRKLGYSAINRKSLILLMSEFKKVQNDIFRDFYERLVWLESAVPQARGQEMEVV